MLKVTEWSKEQIIYPVGRKGRLTGVVVLFLSEYCGVVIIPDSTDEFRYGEKSSNWSSCNNSEDWEPVNITITG